jgi:hypothetical protein
MNERASIVRRNEPVSLEALAAVLRDVIGTLEEIQQTRDPRARALGLAVLERNSGFIQSLIGVASSAGENLYGRP